MGFVGDGWVYGSGVLVFRIQSILEAVLGMFDIVFVRDCGCFGV